MRKLIIVVGMFFLSALIGPGTVLASTIADAIYQADIRATNASYTATHVSAPFTWSTDSLIDGYYIDSGFTNIALQNSSGQDIPFMPGRGSDPWIMWIEQIAQNSVLNYSLYTGGETAMGGKLAYFPGTAGMTVADAASLELGNSFEIELSGYIDTSSGTNKVIIDKGGAFIIYPNNANEVIGIVGSAISISQTSYYSSTASSVYSANWYGQTFIPISDTYVNNITLWCQKILSPSGNFNISIYATSGGVPTGAPLAVGAISASTISTTAGAQTFYLNNSVKLNSGITYALAFSCPSGDASNYIKVWSKNSDAYTSGTKCSSSDSGTSWTAGSFDYYFVLSGYTPAVTLTASGIISGDHSIKIVLAGGTLSLYIDGVLENSAAYVSSIADNPTNWCIAQNGSMPYLYYAKITVGGVLKGSWTWEYAATFTDLSGNGNDATPSFRTTTTDADVTVSVISYTACNQSAFVTSDDDEAVEIVTDDDVGEMPTGWYGNFHPENLPGGQEISDFLEGLDFPPAFFWFAFVYLGAAAITMIVSGFTHKLLPIAASGLCWTVFFCATIGVSWWVLFPVGVIIAGEQANRKMASY
ncbi:MAG: choice-of-anchor R domain-containing protein [Dehalococcoides mccartyi]|uniref:Choice-of-anchor R domain-containing protein n=1 Tax=Dehalococcoides mccartyi TaxID=61435 RepID=A0AB38Z7U6_9CHLR|nr:choice-of-anchor R domain-containing protein [Dehalococcoides mccartyi]MDP4279334.1 choice-of-anchor R domain-containing protein [Dehalococcoides mccartyi]WRO06659.1 choice-of-anchor R domain-containing protein [Dehalococcoides mccartyi]WRO07395.1 choice-of-anchor R domain-containing protein [Dehalococcoides mccartyi]